MRERHAVPCDPGRGGRQQRGGAGCAAAEVATGVHGAYAAREQPPPGVPCPRDHHEVPNVRLRAFLSPEASVAGAFAACMCQGIDACNQLELLW